VPDDAMPVPFFLARPQGDPPWPGVVVLMEGNGMSAQLLRVCERLAAAGYGAIAPDLFHRTGGSDPDKLPDQFMALRTDEAIDDVRGCIGELRRRGASSIGVTGFCMGGRLTYEMSLADLDVHAAAPFYGAGIGRLLGEPRCPVRLFFGGTDEWVPRDEIAAVEAHHPGQVVVYESAGHGFMRDGSDAYDEAAATDAWSQLLTFFGEYLSS
jgi:carboxymethylenebutenolidase